MITLTKFGFPMKKSVPLLMGLAETAEKKLNYLTDNIIHDFIKQGTVHPVDNKLNRCKG
jgi:hypothetical protein